MPEFDFLIAELERKKEHIERAIQELKEAQRTETPEEKQQRQEAESMAARRSRAAKRGWERRKSPTEEKPELPDTRQAA
jgi:hypothetical protein